MTSLSWFLGRREPKHPKQILKNAKLGKQQTYHDDVMTRVTESLNGVQGTLV
jgi:hypothetical protein